MSREDVDIEDDATNLSRLQRVSSEDHCDNHENSEDVSSDENGEEDEYAEQEMLITKKLAISNELIKRVTQFDSPYINAILSGNVMTLEFLFQQGLSCPLQYFQTSYALAAGYHIEEIARAMLESLHSAAKACLGDMEQDFPPCQGCREKMKENAISARTKHKLF